ncbi:MAG: hypothetical protein MRZ34_04320 [Bacillales bacterium]|nr:hypothetical protein [Bacillales bacterium]
MEREEILKSLRDLKSQLPIDGLDEVTISEQAKRFDQARRITERAERRISELEEKLKNDENYRTGRVALYDNSVEQNKVDLEDMIARSDRLAADIIGIDRRLEQERKNRELAEQYNDQALLATLDSNIQRLERRAAKRNSDLEELNANIHELEEAIKEQEEATTGSATVDIEALKDADRAEITRLNTEIKNASTESMLAEYNFATSLNDLITDVERGNISEEVVMAKLEEYRDRLPKQFLLRDAAARSEERIQLEDALAKYEPRLAELEEKLSNEDNYRGVLGARLTEIKESKQNDLDSYTDEIKANGARIAEINNEVRKLEAANISAQRIIDQRQKEMDGLSSQNHPMRKHLRAEIERKSQEITRNMTTMHTLRSEKGMLSGNIDRLRELTKPLKAEIEKINKEIAEDAKKINKSQQRLDRIERDELVAGIAATKSRLAFIEFNVSETIDHIVGDLDASIKAKKEAEKKEAEEKDKKEATAAPVAPVVEPEDKDKTAVPFVLGTGATPLNGVVNQDKDGRNFIVIFGPDGKELLKVEIPKNILVPAAEETKEETTVAPVAPVVEPEKDKDKTVVPVVAFEPASDELKNDAEKKGVIVALKDLGKKMKEKGKEALEWVKKHKKQIAAGGLVVAGLLVGLKGCDANTRNISDAPTTGIVDEVEMPTFNFDDLEEEKNNTNTETPTKTDQTTPDKTPTTPSTPSNTDPTPVTPDPTPVTPDPTPVTPDPTPVTPDPTPVTPDPTPVTPDLSEIILNPGESIINGSGEYVYNDNGNIDANYGDSIIDAEKNGNQVNVTVDKNNPNGNPSSSENKLDSGISEDDVKDFYESLGISYDDVNKTPEESKDSKVNENDELIKEEFVPVGHAGTEPIYELPVEPPAPVEVQSENSMDSSISLDDANAFYEALGLTPPEEVNENTTGGRTR